MRSDIVCLLLLLLYLYTNVYTTTHRVCAHCVLYALVNPLFLKIPCWDIYIYITLGAHRMLLFSPFPGDSETR